MKLFLSKLLPCLFMALFELPISAAEPQSPNTYPLTICVEKENNLPVYLYYWKQTSIDTNRRKRDEKVLDLTEVREMVIELPEGSYSFRLEYHNSNPDVNRNIIGYYIGGHNINSPSKLTYTFINYDLYSMDETSLGFALEAYKFESEKNLFMSPYFDEKAVEIPALNNESISKTKSCELTFEAKNDINNPLFIRINRKHEQIPEERIMLIGNASVTISFPEGDYNVSISDKIELRYYKDVAIELNDSATLSISYRVSGTYSLIGDNDGMPHGEFYRIEGIVMDSQGEKIDLPIIHRDNMPYSRTLVK